MDKIFVETFRVRVFGNVDFAIPILLIADVDTLPPAALATLIPMILTMEASSLWFRSGRSGNKRNDGAKVLHPQRSRDDHFQDAPALSKVTFPCLANEPREKIGPPNVQDQPSPDMQSDGGFERHQFICERVALWPHSRQAHSVWFRHWPPIRHSPPNARPARRFPNRRLRHVHRAAST